MSDQFPIIMTYQLTNPIVPLRNSLRKWLCDKANWECYQRYFHSKDYSSPNLTLAYENLVRDINSSAELSIPKEKDRRKCSPNYVPWWYNICAEAVRKRKSALYEFKQSPSLENFVEVKRIIDTTRKILKQEK